MFGMLYFLGLSVFFVFPHTIEASSFLGEVGSVSVRRFMTRHEMTYVAPLATWMSRRTITDIQTHFQPTRSIPDVRFFEDPSNSEPVQTPPQPFSSLKKENEFFEESIQNFIGKHNNKLEKEELDNNIYKFLSNCNTDIAAVDKGLASLGKNICEIMQGLSSNSEKVVYPRDLDDYLGAYLWRIYDLVDEQSKDISMLSHSISKLTYCIGLFEDYFLEDGKKRPYSQRLEHIKLKKTVD